MSRLLRRWLPRPAAGFRAWRGVPAFGVTAVLLAAAPLAAGAVQPSPRPLWPSAVPALAVPAFKIFVIVPAPALSVAPVNPFVTLAEFAFSVVALTLAAVRPFVTLSEFAVKVAVATLAAVRPFVMATEFTLAF